jgi:hypothetical protein
MVGYRTICRYFVHFERLGNEFDCKGAHGRQIFGEELAEPEQQAEALQGQVWEQRYMLAQVPIHSRCVSGKGDRALANGSDSERRIELGGQVRSVVRLFIGAPERVPKRLGFLKVLQQAFPRELTGELNRLL